MAGCLNRNPATMSAIIEKRSRIAASGKSPNAAPHQEKFVLMQAAIEQGLIIWNKVAGKYELTALGHKPLEQERHKIATGA